MRTGLQLTLMALLAGAGGPVVAQERGSPGEPWRIFFDWSEPEVRGDYDAALAAAAAQVKATPGAELRLDGHSDRSGPAGANMVASLRRADAVRGRLVALGVPAAAIRIVPYGEQRPLVATEDGVREVQNRRVDIWLMPAPR